MKKVFQHIKRGWKRRIIASRPGNPRPIGTPIKPIIPAPDPPAPTQSIKLDVRTKHKPLIKYFKCLSCGNTDQSNEEINGLKTKPKGHTCFGCGKDMVLTWVE